MFDNKESDKQSKKFSSVNQHLNFAVGGRVIDLFNEIKLPQKNKSNRSVAHIFLISICLLVQRLNV